MKNFLRFGFVLLFLFLGFDGVGQRKLPYPIILVHGWTGSDETWFDFANYLRYRVGLNVDLDFTNQRAGVGSRISFNLNCDDNNYTSNLLSDLCDNYTVNSSLNTNNDIFIINFDTHTLSNQAAAVKQGEAVGLAVQKVLTATGASKVILMGHSMGGLAIREYLQNASHWKYDLNNHRVAKAITIGTPHAGSDFGTFLGAAYGQFVGKDTHSEAVRDLRTDNGIGINDRGVYLYGGSEPSFLSPYYNTDINCDGDETDYSLTGLNYKSIPTNLAYTCLIGTTFYGVNGDLIVSKSSANLNNNYSSLNADIFYLDYSQKETSGLDIVWHTELPRQSFNNTLTLDEPSTFNHAYEIYANATSTKIGLFSRQSNGSSYDTDRYKIYLSRGITKIEVNAYQGSYPSIGFYNPYETNVANSINTTSANSNTLITANAYTGTHFFDFIGDSGGSWRSYNYSVTNKPPSDLYSNATSTCIGGIVNLYTSETGFDSYKWYRNGQYFTTTTTNYLNATTTGVGNTIFTVETYFGSVGIYSNNSKQITTYASPSAPILTATSLDGTSSTTGLNICNGEAIALTTNCASGSISSWFDGLNTYSNTLSLYYFNATTTTTYTAKCSNYFCNSTNSSPVRIVKEPNIQSIRNGNWQDPTMWANNYVPLNCQTVTIQTGHTVTVQINDAKAKSIIINGKLNFINFSPTVKGKVGLGI